MHSLNKARLGVIVFLCLTTATQAHQIWIEQPADGSAMIRFGEFGENLREASPGLLDKFGRPTATLISAKGEQRVDARKTANGFALPFKAGRTETIVAQDATYPLYDFKKGEQAQKGWNLPAARLVGDLRAREPLLVLDIVPSGRPGEFRLFFKGQPLPKVKVAIVTPSGWAREALSDERGVVSFSLPWRGTYVAEVSHTDGAAGERQGATGGERYDTVSHVTSLTYAKPDGLAPIAPGKAAKPNP